MKDETLTKILETATGEFNRAGLDLEDIVWYLERAYLMGKTEGQMIEVLKNRTL